LSALRDREVITRRHLETKNELLRRQLQEKETQLACMASLSMEALQCRTPAKSYGLYLKDQWLQFQIKTLAQGGTMPFQDYRQLMDLCDQRRLEDVGIYRVSSSDRTPKGHCPQPDHRSIHQYF